MISFLRKVWRESSVFNYGYIVRDRWIVSEAKKVPAGSKILDIGCGTAPYRHLFAHCDYKTHDFKQLDASQNRAGKEYAKVDYVSDIISIPVPDSSFDVLICTEVLEHVPEPIRALKEFSRIVKPGGVVLLSAPLAGFVHQEPYHFYGGFSPFFYQKFLKEFGFKDVRVMKNEGFFKFYGMMGVRFVESLSPKNVSKNWLIQILWAPFWCLLVLFLPFKLILMHLIDPLDRSDYQTAGYHVKAKKAK
jgi:SAM-dependent methyltransferase